MSAQANHTHLPFSDSYRPGERDPVSDSGPILRHRSGPSSQLSGPIAGFLACIEDAQRLPLPSALSPRRGPTGLHRTQKPKPESLSTKDRENLCVLCATKHKYLIADCEEKGYY